MLEGANGDNPAEKVLFYKKRELDKEVELLTPEEIRKRVYNYYNEVCKNVIAIVN